MIYQPKCLVQIHHVWGRMLRKQGTHPSQVGVGTSSSMLANYLAISYKVKRTYVMGPRNSTAVMYPRERHAYSCQ